MKARIVTIANRGDIQNERVHLSILADTTLSFFLVLKSTDIDGKGVLNGALASFWFPSVNVKAGDQVVLYSRAGTNSSEKGNGTSTNYFFFWQLTSPQWAHPSQRAVLIEAVSWETSKPE